MKNREYLIRKTVIFVITALLHILGFHWFIHMQIELKKLDEAPPAITVVKLIPGPLISPPDPNRSGRPSRAKELVKRNQTDLVHSPAVHPSTPAGQPSTTRPAPVTEKKLLPLSPSLVAPPADVSKLPPLSANTERIQDIVKNFDQRNSTTGSISLLPPGQPGASEGTGGMNHIVFNVKNYDMSPWAKRVLLSIEKNWEIPLIMKTKADQPLEIVTVIEKNGQIATMEIKQSSHAEAFDISALTAVRLSQPFPRLPPDFPAAHIEVRFIFTHDLIAQ